MIRFRHATTAEVPPVVEFESDGGELSPAAIEALAALLIDLVDGDSTNE
jgi:hypothetical protein